MVNGIASSISRQDIVSGSGVVDVGRSCPRLQNLLWFFLCKLNLLVFSLDSAVEER